MDVCLLTRYFDTNHTEGVGIGRVSGELYRHLIPKNLYLYPIASESGGLFKYLKYSSLEIPLNLLGKRFDVYHALTPIEAFWIPKSRSIVTINDLFSLINVKGMGSGLKGSKTLMALAQFYYLKACEEAIKCRIIVCISTKTKEDVIRILKVKEDKIRIIRPGISNTLIPLPKNNNNKLTIGYIGALDNRKRVDILIKAFKESSINARLLIGGQGLDTLKLKSLSIGSNIDFLGYIKEEDVNYFYNSLDLLIFPTSMEGYGLPLVEAMACGIPPVVLEDSDIPSEIKDRCIVVKNLTRFLKTIERYPNLLKEVDIKDNIRFANKHKWERTAEEYYKLYEEIYNR